MCLLYQDKEKNYLREELPLSIWQKAVDEAAAWGPNINITGGEPFLRNDLIEFVRYIKAKGLRCSINTNGVKALPEKLKEILELKLDRLTFSIDGPESIHERIRGEKGAFKKMSENIRFVIESRINSPAVWGVCVISKENVDVLDRIVDIAKELRLDGLQFQQVMFLDENNMRLYNDEVKAMGEKADISLEGLNHGQEGLDAGLLIEKMKEIKKKSRILKVPISFVPQLTYSNLPRYYGDVSWTYASRCLVPWTNMTIAPDGDVFPCVRIKMGNIKNDSIRSIWNAEPFTRIRKRIRERGVFARCKRCCHLGLF
jgi:MoaA/NifB/PqqE/SkfB family radical SAM enzyme